MIGKKFILRISLILVYFFVIILIIATIIAIANTLKATIRDLQNNRNIFLVGALTTALVPSAAVLFWVWKAIGQIFAYRLPKCANISGPILRDDHSERRRTDSNLLCW
jgi:hypothetical protein